jgi:hypothetical protein
MRWSQGPRRKVREQVKTRPLTNRGVRHPGSFNCAWGDSGAARKGCPPAEFRVLPSGRIPIMPRVIIELRCPFCLGDVHPHDSPKPLDPGLDWLRGVRTPESHSVYECLSCRAVWHQPRNRHYGIDAMMVGYRSEDADGLLPPGKDEKAVPSKVRRLRVLPGSRPKSPPRRR